MISWKTILLFLAVIFTGVIFIFGTDTAWAQTGGACPAGESYTKPSPGIGPMPCGANQCRPDGQLHFTACVTQSECLAIRGTTDGGNKAGCVDSGGIELFCCRTQKNRCNAASTDPNKLFLCTKDTMQCTGAGGTVFGPGYGCGNNFPTCCQFADSPTQPMKVVGEPLLPASAIQRASGGSSAAASTASAGASRVKRAYEDVDSFCFTQQECLTVQGKFESGKGCPFKGDQAQGYCVAGDPEYKLQNPMFGVSTISGLRNMIGLVFNGAIGILIIASALFFIWGAFKYMLSSVVSSIQKSKEVMVDSVVGLVLGLGAYALLANINPNLLSLNMLKIYMINRMNFYHVVYCEDLVNQNVKLMDAGTPSAPLSYSAQLPKEGFKTSIDEAKCGQEYFIEGGDSMAVCMGKKCEGSDELCLNCSTGLGKDCKTNSAIEHSCSDCKFGGNIQTSLAFKPKEIWLYLFCNKRTSEGINVVAKELINLENLVDESSKIITGASTGYVTNFCIKDFKLSKDKVVDFFDKDCASAPEQGMMMFVFADMEFEGTGFDKLETIKQRIAVNPAMNAFVAGATSLGAGAGVFVIAFPPAFVVGGGAILAASAVALVAGGIADTKADNLYFPVNKNVCNTNLLQTTLVTNEGLIASFLTTEKTAFENLMSDYAKATPTLYDQFTKNTWSKEEVLNMIESKRSIFCGFGIN